MPQYGPRLIMLYSLLRKINTLINSELEYDVNKHLHHRDIVFYKWGIYKLIRYANVIQFQSRIIDLPLPHVRKNQLCPVSAMFNALSVLCSMRCHSLEIYLLIVPLSHIVQDPR